MRAPRRPLGIVGGRDATEVRQHRRRRVAVLECRRVHEGLERRSGLAFAAGRAIEGAAAVVPPAAHRQDVARRRIDGDERGFEPWTMKPIEPRRHSEFRCPLDLREKRGVYLPVGWVVAAELDAELLTKIFLCPAGPRIARLPEQLDPRPDR